MNTELEYQKETGLPSRKRNTGNPHSYTNEYIEWLEQQVKLLHLHNVIKPVCDYCNDVGEIDVFVAGLKVSMRCPRCKAN